MTGDSPLRNLTKVMDLGFALGAGQPLPGLDPKPEPPDLATELRAMAKQAVAQAEESENPENVANLLGIATGLRLAADRAEERRAK